jgi:hypothetical protein
VGASVLALAVGGQALLDEALGEGPRRGGLLLPHPCESDDGDHERYRDRDGAGDERTPPAANDEAERLARRVLVRGDPVPVAPGFEVGDEGVRGRVAVLAVEGEGTIGDGGERTRRGRRRGARRRDRLAGGAGKDRVGSVPGIGGPVVGSETVLPRGEGRKGSAPTSSSWRMAPRLQTSARASNASPRACSGLAYPGVPATPPDFAASCASPQSTTSVSPRSPIMMFAGLRSRWRMPAACACATAWATAISRSTSLSRAGPRVRASTDWSVSPRIRFIT